MLHYHLKQLIDLLGMPTLISDSIGLYETERALHEYTGLVAMTLGLD
jgi:hypothetical protein